MKQIKSIAVNTIKETMRDKIYYSFFLFAVFLVFITYFLGQLTYRDEAKITMDLGLAAMNLSSVLISIFLGVSLVLKELDKKTLYTIVSRPLPRYKFILGKYFGLLTVIFMNIFAMTLIIIINIYIIGGSIPLIFYQAVVLMFFEMIIIIAISMFFSTFTTSVMAAVFTFGLYFISHSSSTFNVLIKKSEGLSQITLKILNFISPNFAVLNLKNLVPNMSHVSSETFFTGIAYSLIYCVLFLTGTFLVFQRKDFK